MAQPYIGEIRMFGGNFAPAGWAFCDGQTLPISENDALFVLIGTRYGGDGQSTFNLPNLQSRIPLHQGTSPAFGTQYIMGEMAGAESVTLNTQQIPVHNHAMLADTSTGVSNTPKDNIFATPTATKLYRFATPSDPLPTNLIQGTGGSQPHDNLQPYICINYIISLFGIFPTQT
jgi:microcystin-dependent protein